MEQARLLLAIVLSFLVFVIWNALFVEKHAPRKPVKTKSEAVENKAGSGEKKSPAVMPPLANKSVFSIDSQTEKVLANRPDRTIIVENGLYRAEFSEKAGAITRFVLKKYHETADPQSPEKVLFEGSEGILPIVRLSGQYSALFEHAVFTSDSKPDHLVVHNKPARLSFYCTAPNGLRIEKSYVFSPETYLISVNVLLANNTSFSVKAPLVVSLFVPASAEKRRYSFEGPFLYLNNDLKEIKIKSLRKKSEFEGMVSWVGLEDQYFMTTLIPGKQHESTRVHMAINAGKRLEIDHINQIAPISPKNKGTYSFSLYLGPKKISILKAIGYHLDKAVNFGFFDFIAKPCLWAMNMIYEHLIPNYGIAIILLTIFFKLLFWPLGNKSYKSMAEMKKLQPLMAEIREKYKDDKKRMNEEIMGLYKTYKVNPLSGCLPMLVQIPVFFAFYRMLYAAIELRHAPFFLWINDLSAPDRLFHFKFSIPFMSPPYGIPVLTIIMGITMFLQQKMSPPPGDPSQAKFMMLMPVIFTVIFINFPSGLVLYWLVNNILSISQQYYITRKTV